ncbi:hypothetical protein [Sphingobacterium multivorum]|uniref:hypothetical protein n=1 Tax=Sphingobacterium multivorum TaxID=28454 RepID=UPI00289966E3|nr:hypothetical protein [Sphingobacterium multivorum]
MFIVPILFWYKNKSNREKFNYSTLIKCENIRDIIKIYGKESIIDHGQYEFEGQPIENSSKYTILSGSKNQFEIVYLENTTIYGFDQIESEWILPLNLKIGMSLSDLEKTNQAPVSFYGFEIDYQTSGLVTNWHEGKLSKLEGLSLEANIIPSETYSSDPNNNQLSGSHLNSEMSFVRDGNLKLGRIELIKLNKQ